jgi:hypothetical protein
VKIAERIYRGLLLLYPPSFRREYRELMQQALRDQMRDSGGGFDRLRLWTRTAVDLLASASVLRLEDLMSNRSMLMGIGPYLFCLTAAVFLGHFELRTDDAGVEVGLLLVFTFIFGCWNPKGAWLAPLLGLSVPLAELLWGHPGPGANHSGDLLILAGFIVVVSIIGSYSGVLTRRLVASGVSR